MLKRQNITVRFSIYHLERIKLILLTWLSSLPVANWLKSVWNRKKLHTAQKKKNKKKQVVVDASPEKQSDDNNKNSQFDQSKSNNTYLMVQICVFIFEMFTKSNYHIQIWLIVNNPGL